MVGYEQRGRVAVLTIRRPEARNAVTGDVATEIVLTGDPIDAARAYELGMVNQLVEPGGALDAALAMAERICANAPLAVRASRRVLLDTLTASDEEAWGVTNGAFADI